MPAFTLFDIMNDHVIVAADGVLSMVAAWDGDKIIRYYTIYNYNKYSENDMYEDQEDTLNIDDARIIAELYFQDIHKDLKAA